MIQLHNAVTSMYPNAIAVYGNDINSLKAIDANENEIIINSEDVISKLVEMQAAEVAQEQAQTTAKASALAKLTALGLTQDEVKALIG